MAPGDDVRRKIERLEEERQGLVERASLLLPVTGLCQDERWAGALLPMLRRHLEAFERQLVKLTEPDWGAYRFLQGQAETLRSLLGYPESLIAEIRMCEDRIAAIDRDLGALRSRS